MSSSDLLSSVQELVKNVKYIKSIYINYNNSTLEDAEQFQNAISLQKKLFSVDLPPSLVEEIKLNGLELTFFNEILHLCVICDVTNDKLSLQIWKYFYTQINKESLTSGLTDNVSAAMTKSLFAHLLQSINLHGKLTEYSRDAKLFHSKLFLCVTKINYILFERLANVSADAIYQFVVHLQTLFIETLIAEAEGASDEDVLKKHKNNIHLAIMMTFDNLSQFHSQVLNAKGPLSLVNVFNLLSLISSKRFQFTPSVFETLFKSIGHVAVAEMNRPPIYKFFLVSLCSIVYKLHQNQFEALENALVMSIFSESRLQALLAVDVWCFVCRLVSTGYLVEVVSICLNHLRKISASFGEKNLFSNVMLAFFTSRVLLYIPGKKRVEILNDYAFGNERNLSLWTVFIAHFFPMECCNGLQKNYFQEQFEKLFTRNNNNQVASLYPLTRLALKTLPLNKIAESSAIVSRMILDSAARQNGQRIEDHVWHLFQDTFKIDLIFVALLDGSKNEEHGRVISTVREFLVRLTKSQTSPKVLCSITERLAAHTAKRADKRLARNAWLDSLQSAHSQEPKVQRLIDEHFAADPMEDVPRRCLVRSKSHESTNPSIVDIPIEIDKTADRLFQLFDQLANKEPKPGYARRKAKELSKRLNLY